ncbi:MFS transporter [Lancefieldella rimae]|uniref:MFS transporter n=1 Tax=Lancefieldella rimae TaxID=1383 RepID=UPI001CABA7B0|nr:MFS transporter [Lancefieldella rimae]MBF4803745.1 MFS transporter [Lancefieldella rimae]
MKAMGEARSTSARIIRRFWALVWGLGLIGQLVWVVENQWFNTFIYAKIAKDPTIIGWMVAVSALTTTVSTFLFGTASDRMGRRKPFVVWGYILWGAFTIAFGCSEFITGGSPTNDEQVLMMAATAVVLGDAVMSFFGSMGNDAGFNAWMNDNMNSENRGAIGAAIATQPVIGTIVGTVAGGLIVGSEDNYMGLFVIFGAAAISFGIVAQLTMREAPGLAPKHEGGFWQQLASGFKLRELLAYRELVAVFLVLMVYFTAFDVYYPHMGNFMIYYLGFDAGSIGIIQGVPLILAMTVVIPTTHLVNKGRLTLAATISIILSCLGIGLIGLLVRPETVDPTTIFNPMPLAGMLVFGCGYIMFMQVMNVWMKQLFPDGSRGQFEGFRIIFFVLIPWLLSPFISNPLIMANGAITDANGMTAYLPTHTLLLVGAALTLFSFVPLIMAARLHGRGQRI